MFACREEYMVPGKAHKRSMGNEQTTEEVGYGALSYAWANSQAIGLIIQKIQESMTKWKTASYKQPCKTLSQLGTRLPKHPIPVNMLSECCTQCEFLPLLCARVSKTSVHRQRQRLAVQGNEEERL